MLTGSRPGSAPRPPEGDEIGGRRPRRDSGALLPKVMDPGIADLVRYAIPGSITLLASGLAGVPPCWRANMPSRAGQLVEGGGRPSAFLLAFTQVSTAASAAM